MNPFSRPSLSLSLSPALSRSRSHCLGLCVFAVLSTLSLCVCLWLRRSIRSSLSVPLLLSHLLKFFDFDYLMAEGNLDLPDDLLASKPSDRSWTSKVEVSGGHEEEKVLMGLLDESKDQGASESSIPLSPQWLYAKPTEPKMEMRAPTSGSLGSSTDPNQKEGWRLDGAEDRKDWRRNATDNDSSRRWREEERETGLLGGRRDRRKAERRVDNLSIRETSETRVLPTSDRWHDGRNSGHETRRDSKWSSRWGPEDKDKDSRSEKRTEMEKEDAHSDNQSFLSGNRSASERDSDSRDKWRPRHRMEAHSGGSNAYRAAPGFGLDRGRVDGSNLGFTLGRGRSNVVGRGSSTGPIGSVHPDKKDNIPGRPAHSVDSFCYPRGKLLDIYRRQKLGTLLTAMPDEMEKLSPITQVGFIEPLAFVAPDAEEEVILGDILRGKITSSGMVYSSYRKGRSTENVTGAEDIDSTEQSQGILSPSLNDESIDASLEASNAADQADNGGTFSRYGSLQRNRIDEKYIKEEKDKVTGAVHGLEDGFGPMVSDRNGACGAIETDGAQRGASQINIGEKWQMVDTDFTRAQFDSPAFSSSFDARSKLPDDSSSLFVLPSAQQNQSINTETNGLERIPVTEELSLCYIDPQGVIQGPFIGADIILWLEQGFFGTDLLVRLADAPEGTPFQELGKIIPYLKGNDGYANSSEPNSKLEHLEELDASLPAPATLLRSNSSALNDLGQPLPDFNSISAQDARSRVSEPEVPLPLPHSEGQSFHKLVTHDEEIVFPGHPSNTGYSIAKSTGSSRPSSENSLSHPSLPNELTEPGVPNQNDNKLHPFGLLWSELEGHMKHAKPSIPSGTGRAAPFGAVTDPALGADAWSDVYRKNTLPEPNIYQDAMAAHHLSRMEQESNHFDLAEQLMAQQFQQQQLQQRNLLSHAHMNESVLDHVPTQNLIHHQQLANRSAPDLEHLLTLQLQQRQMQLQQHHQLQQQQQFQQQQKLLQEQQQSQVRQVLLEQLLRNQIHDPSLAQSHIDPIRANNVLDQVLLERQLLHELHQQPHHPSRHVDPSLEQLIQAKFGHIPQQDPHRDLFDILSRPQHGQMPTLEQQLLQQEQLQARQLMGLRQRTGIEGERHPGSKWPADESDQFLRTLAGSHRAHSSGFGPLDIYQRQQRPPHDEQLSHLERNVSLQDRLRQGLYDPGSLSYERSMSMPAGAPGMNLEALAMARAHGLDMQEPTARMQSAGQVGAFSSGIPPHNPHHLLVPNQFHASELDAIEGRWSENNGQLENDWMESRIQPTHISAERQNRESEVKMSSKDSTLWMSDGLNEEKSKQLLMELLHQKSGHQTIETLDAGKETRAAAGLYSGSSSSEHPFNLSLDREAALNNSFAVGSYGSNSCEALQDERAASEVMPFRSDAGVFIEEDSRFVGISETGQANYANSNLIGKSSMSNEFSESEVRKHGSKSVGMMKGPAFEIQEGRIDQAAFAALDRGEISINALSSQPSMGGKTSFYNENIGPCNSFEEVSKERVPVPPKGQENILLRRPPISHTSSSHEGLPELLQDTVMRGKPPSSGTSEGGRRDPGVILLNQSTDAMASSKKDMRFRRTSSCGDADVSEASFIDMLKSNAKKTAPTEPQPAGFSEASDGSQGGRGGKKKGKKGRQIDPALLGFKVTSNRIMMGEIQRIED